MNQFEQHDHEEAQEKASALQQEGRPYMPLMEDELGEDHIEKEQFDEQFKDALLLTGHDEDGIETTVKYTKVEPENPISEEWVVYVGGLGQAKESYYNELLNLAQSGRKVLFMNPVQGSEVAEKDAAHLENFDLPEQIPTKASDVAKVLESLNAEKIDLIGHSQGAAVGATLATMRPDLVDNLVLECPAGVAEPKEGSDYLVAPKTIITTGKAKKVLQADIASMQESDEEVIAQEGDRRDASLRRTAETFEAYPSLNLKETHFRLITEIAGAMKVDILPLLAEIKNRGTETKVTLLNANKDMTFTSESIGNRVGFDGNRIDRLMDQRKKAEGDEVAQEELTEELEEVTQKPFENYIDSWVNFAYKEASHTEASNARAGLLQQIVNANKKGKSEAA